MAKLQSLAQAHGLEGKFALLLKASDSVQKPEHAKSLKLACWVSNHRELTSCWAIPLCGDQLPALPQATVRITVPKPCVEAAVWQQWHATPWAALKQWAPRAPAFHSANGFKETRLDDGTLLLECFLKVERADVDKVLAKNGQDAVFAARLASEQGRKLPVEWISTQSGEDDRAYFTRVRKPA